MPGTTLSHSYFSTVTLSDAATQNPVTITAGGTISAAGTGLLGEAGTAWTVTNSGTVQGTGAGVELLAGGLVSNTSHGTIAGVAYGVYLTGGTGTVTNAGSIYAGGIGVDLTGGGLVSNQSGGTIDGATYGVNATGTVAATIINQGLIVGQTSPGVYLSGGGIVSNTGTGVIAGSDDGIEASGYPVTVINLGSITAQEVAGVLLNAGGLVSNAGTGSILGGEYGVAAGAAATVLNQGYIGGPGYKGVAFFAGGYVSNASTGTITGAYFGVQASDASASVTNYGSISSSAAYDGTLPFDAAGVELADGGTVINGPSAFIGATWRGVEIGNTAASVGGTLLNQGTIYASNTIDSTGTAVWLHGPGLISNAATGTIAGGPLGVVAYYQTTLVNAGSIYGISDAVSFAGGGTIANQSGGTIDGAAYGVSATGTVATTVTNQGRIAGQTSPGVYLSSGGLVSNAGSGVIAGYDNGIKASGYAATVINLGSVTAQEDAAVLLNAGGSLSNAASGRVLGGSYGVAAAGAPATVTNQGVISGPGNIGVFFVDGGYVSNAGTGIISGGTIGVDIAGAAGTVTNASTISGTTYSVELAAGYANRLVLDPGAKFNGTVTGGNALGATAVSILELASGATAGTLTGLGTKYIDFAQIIIDAGASWTLPAVPAGYTVTILGTLTNTGTLTTPVTITAGGYFQNASGGTIVGSGVDAIRAGAGATVVNAGLIDPANYGVYLPSGGTTTNVSSGTIVGTVAGVKIAGGTGTVVNAGSIFGTGTGSSGVDLLSGGTVLDSGTISGVSDAVHFYAGSAGLLAIDPGAVLSGTVDGGNTIGAAAVSTLELASGASTGTVSSFGAKYIDFAQISVDAGARWILNDSTSLAAGTTLTDSGTVTVTGTATPSEIAFAGTAALVKLTVPQSFTGSVADFGQGDTLDIGPGTVGTIDYESTGSGSSPVLTVLSNTGGTLFSAPFAGSGGNPVGGSTGTFTPTTLTSGAVVAGPFELATAGGDTLLEALPPSTWNWIGTAASNPNDPSSWSLASGPGNQRGTPGTGDTAIANNGTITLQPNSTLNGSTVYLTGTSEMSFTGTQDVGNGGTSESQPGISYQNPTVDQTSLISNDPLPPASTTLNFAGYNINDGTLISNGGAGSSLTINVTQDGTAPGYLINYGDIEADTGNTVTIAVAGTSELFNANLIYANGGTVVIDGGTGIAGGYAPMLGGAALVGNGGTLVLNAGFPAGTGGSSPTFAFYDGDSGDTLKLEQVRQFGGRILFFQQGDTIDLGSALSVGTIVVDNDGPVLLESNSGSVLATLVLSTGAYNAGTFGVTAVSAGTLTADGFTLTTGGDGDTLLTTGVVDSVWNSNSSGTWQTASDWSTGVVPGSTATAIIGLGTTGAAPGTSSQFVLTTGSTAVDVNSLSEVSTGATLQITSDTTVGTSINDYGLQQIAGLIEITSGNTLTAPFFRQITPAADLQIDAGGVLAIPGHANLGFANNGTLSEFTVVNGTTFANGNTIGLFVQGFATVDGGTIDAGPVLNGSSVVSTGGLISIGQDGGGTPASMTVEDGGTVTDTYAFLSSDPSSFGSLTLTGSGTTWDDAGDPTDTYDTRGQMIVGDDNQAGNQPSPLPSGTAQLLVENGATLIEATRAEIGESADSAGSVTITSGGIWNIGTSGAAGGPGGFINVGDSGSGTLVIDDDGVVNILAGTGTFTSDGNIITSAAGAGIAHNVGSDGTVDVSGGGQLNVAISSTIANSGMGVGQLGHGVLDIFNGGTVSITGGGISAGSDSTVIAVGTTVAGDGTIVIGGTFDSDGTVESSGGASSLLTFTGGMSVGKAGTGTLYVETGGTLDATANGISVGNSAGSYGLAEINGGLLEVATSGLTVGTSGTGVVELSSGTISLDGAVQIGDSAAAVGTVVVTGGTLKSTGGGINVGTAGTGLLSINGGTVSVSSGMAIGLSLGATGFATIANGLLSEAAALDVGGSGTGTLSVGSGGTVSAASGVSIGTAAGSTGTVIVNGGTLDDNGIFEVGNAGTGTAGTLIVEGGGLVDQTGVNFNLGESTGTQGTVVVNGGSLISQGSFAVGGTNATGTLLVENSGQLTSDSSSSASISDINASGTGAAAATVTTDGVWTVDGQLMVGGAGSGALTINTGGVVNVIGATDVGDLSGAAGTITVGSGGTLDGSTLAVANESTGIAAGTLTIASGGTVAIATLTEGAGGTVTVTGSLSATTEIVIGQSGTGLPMMTVGSLGVVSDSGSFFVGSAITGTLTVQAGGTVTGAGANTLQIESGSTATVDGTLGGFGNVVVGGPSSGTLVDGGTVEGAAVTVENGGVFDGGSLIVGTAVTQGDIKTLTIDTGGTVDVTSASVGQGSSLVLAGGLLDPLGLTLNAGGVISGFGTLEANLANASTVTASGGTLEVTGSVTGTGTMAIAASATLVLPGSVASGQIIAFAANTGVLQIGSIGFSGTIGNNLVGDIQAGDTIVVTGVTDATSATVVGSNTLQIVSTSLGDIDLQLDPEQGFLGDAFHVNTIGGNAVVTETTTPCYLAGTHILTGRGEIQVEALRIGDRVVTLDGTEKAIKWIGRRSYSGAIPTGQRDVIPILIRQGALGDQLPARDLIVSPLHAMYLDGVLVPAEHLVNGSSILRAPDIDPIRYFHIELDRHDVIYAEDAPAETFVDCDSRAMFHNAAEFDTLYPGDATPRWQYCAPRVEGGERLAAVKRAIDRRAGIALPEPGAPPGRLEGRLDGVEGGRISGWAFHPDRPAEPVWLEVLDGDGAIARVHARRYRADLEASGIGDGRHGFELHLTGQMRTRREIRVRRVEDGVELDGSPLVVEARGGEALLADARRVIAAAILDPSDAAGLDALATELLHGVDALRQARTVIARSEATRQSPARLGQVPPRAGDCFGPAGLAMTRNTRLRRALIIDAQLPRPEHDAGSQAILSHAAALTALGFQVEFVAAHELARAEQASAALEQAGYVVHRAPVVASVEEVLRRHRNAFDVVYLHRLANAEAYAPLARAWQARARLLYCVADLHHVRLARQAAVQASAEVAEEARAVRVRELNAMRLCDAVITHSTAEAAYLAQVAPRASVHVVAWTPGARPRPVPLAARQGVAAIGSWSHEPNVDAVRWLVSDIMPRVWAAAPRIELLVVGSDWPARVPWIGDARVKLVGAVTSIETLLGMLRVSVAPLRFGAGLKGKVLDSFATEVPCVMTPVAAEGFLLEGTLPGLVAEDAAALASLIVRLHEETPFHRAAAGDGLALAAKFSPEAVRAAMAAAVGVREVVAVEAVAEA